MMEANFELGPSQVVRACVRVLVSSNDLILLR